MAYGSLRPRVLQIVATVVLTILIGAVSVLAVLSYHSAFGTSDPASCLSDHCFCEAPSLSGLAQPINAITSLVFVVFGVWVLMTREKIGKKTKERGLVLAFGIILIYFGVSSFFYHGTLSSLGQFLDIFSRYVFAILLLVGALLRRNQIKLLQAVVLFIVLNIAFGLLQLHIPESHRLVFGLLLLPGILLEQQPKTTGYKWFSKQVRFLYIGIGTLTAGYIFRILDSSSAFCMTHSVIQGHAIWHILLATSVYMVILHYKHTPHKINSQK
ncbi:hypothetical protein EPN95_02670 [Patescibacteria group bacterium]|nr:MAG: hypothetical protein EPN95_02670 [Patescibacteria group bacterium]